jgi:peptidoglycan hydrolase-like protein with peptidoglycan-binding domain
VPGSRTREAIRAFQKSAGLPVDGYASATLLEHLRQEGQVHTQSVHAQSVHTQSAAPVAAH